MYRNPLKSCTFVLCIIMLVLAPPAFALETMMNGTDTSPPAGIRVRSDIPTAGPTPDPALVQMGPMMGAYTDGSYAMPMGGMMAGYGGYPQNYSGYYGYNAGMGTMGMGGMPMGGIGTGYGGYPQNYSGYYGYNAGMGTMSMGGMGMGSMGGMGTGCPMMSGMGMGYGMSGYPVNGTGYDTLDLLSGSTVPFTGSGMGYGMMGGGWGTGYANPVSSWFGLVAGILVLILVLVWIIVGIQLATYLGRITPKA